MKKALAGRKGGLKVLNHLLKGLGDIMSDSGMSKNKLVPGKGIFPARVVHWRGIFRLRFCYILI